MRRIAAFALTFSLSLASIGAPPARPADAPDVNGSWKLVIVAGRDVDFAIFDAKATDGKIAAKVNAVSPALGPIRQAEGTIEGDKVAIVLPSPGEPTTFRGTLDKEGKKARGVVKFRGSTYQSRIERTEAKALGGMQAPANEKRFGQAVAIKDPKERVARLRELIAQDPEGPLTPVIYAQILGQAEAAGLPADDVAKLVGRWVDDAKPYGPEWTAEVQGQAVRALQGKKAFAPLATELAMAADKALPADATTDQRSVLANLLASSARLAGNEAVAAEAEGRAKGYDAKLDAEYHEKVPPFKPGTYAGRPDGKGDRVVLMEIFTGAECPPCVAADVGFDALLKTYKPAEVIGLQYHLHIPGPDPLTNADAVARQGYYGPEIRGTPSTFFNGKAENGNGGGPMARAEAKYKEYRGLIDPTLAAEKQADLQLAATRSGDEVKITASAKVDGGSKEGRPRLRLVLVEEAVRYPGGNKLRFHHNVVRGFPGGVEGRPLEKGEATVEATVKLDDLRKAQDEYNTQYPTSPRGRAFPNPLPPIEMADLAVVAFVQDDADHAVWHAVQVEVKSSHP